MGDSANFFDSDFDEKQFVTTYQRIIISREECPSFAARAHLASIAMTMRNRWRLKFGSDTLHTLAFGNLDSLVAGQAVSDYRQVIRDRDSAPSEAYRRQQDEIANRFRTAWKVQTGTDTLHVLAFGESLKE